MRIIETSMFKAAGRKWRRTKGMPYSRDAKLKSKIRRLIETDNPMTEKPYNRKEIADQLGISWQTVNRICKQIKEEDEQETKDFVAYTAYGSPYMKRR